MFVIRTQHKKGDRQMAQTWLITAALAASAARLAEAVLAKGHRLVATARKPGALADLVEATATRSARSRST